MRPRTVLCLALLAVLIHVALVAPPAWAQTRIDDEPAVQGVFFFSPACAHCELVMSQHMPGIYERFGGAPTLLFDTTQPSADAAFYLMSNGTLSLLFVDVTVEAGAQMFDADAARLGIAQAGVPRVDIGDAYLTGSVDIPERLPLIIEDGLESGGLPWPPTPGIDEALATIPAIASDAGPAASMESADAVTALPATTSGSVWDRVGNDPLGNGLSMLLLVAMLASLALVPILVRRGSLTDGPAWLVPALALIGIGVSAYLGSIEASGAMAICGPVGDCNAVQQSEYAALFGVPIGVLGVVAYATLLAAWIVSRATGGRVAARATVVVAAIALGGMLFSIYLTFLEPFVIGATCMWCLTSALSVLGLFWATAGSGWAALNRLQGGTFSFG